jgi:hypothetical protein
VATAVNCLHAGRLSEAKPFLIHVVCDVRDMVRTVLGVRARPGSVRHREICAMRECRKEKAGKLERVAN